MFSSVGREILIVLFTLESDNMNNCIVLHNSPALFTLQTQATQIIIFVCLFIYFADTLILFSAANSSTLSDVGIRMKIHRKSPERTLNLIKLALTALDDDYNPFSGRAISCPNSHMFLL